MIKSRFANLLFVISLLVSIGLLLQLIGVCDAGFMLGMDSEPKIRCKPQFLEVLVAIPSIIGFYLTFTLAAIAGTAGLVTGLAVSVLLMIACVVFCANFLIQLALNANKSKQENARDESIELFLQHKARQEPEKKIHGQEKDSN